VPRAGGQPQYHLVDEHGCGLNDPNGPFWDPVHGVAHVFYQIHLAEDAVSPHGRGSDWGHWVSKDLVSWASMPVGVWNGLSLDQGTWPPRQTMYDTVAIFSGSALVVDGAGPGGQGAGVVMFYPGLCDTDDWPACTTHDRDHEPVLLATAVPADYAGDALLTNWSKPRYNPIWPAINHSGDPSSPWQTRSGEWRLRTSDTVLGAASTAQLLAGVWYEIGPHEGFVDSNCPSFFPLPPATPGTEDSYAASRLRDPPPPTHVQKTSACGIRPGAPASFHGCFDRWQAGTYNASVPPRQRGAFVPTPGWEDMFEHRFIDAVPAAAGGKLANGAYYASKDAPFPSADGNSPAERRLNFGYVLAPAGSGGGSLASSGAHALPREVTFNARTRALEQAPLAETAQLRDAPAFNRTSFDVGAAGGSRAYRLPVPATVARQSELLVVFPVPLTPPGSFTRGRPSLPAADTFGVAVAVSTPSVPPLECTVTWVAPAGAQAARADDDHEYFEVLARCGNTTQPLRLLPGERALEMRVFCDWTFVEVFFQRGRVVMTTPLILSEGGAEGGVQGGVGNDGGGGPTITLLRSGGGGGGERAAEVKTADVARATLWPMKPIMTTPEAVRAAPRVH
jgi:hypothetical protein